MSRRSAQDWVIRFYVLDSNDREFLRHDGIVSTGYFYPLSFLAQQDGVYTMHFDNSVGGSFNKTVSLSYRKTQSVMGISLENLLLYMSIATVAVILIAVVIMLIERSKTKPNINRATMASSKFCGFFHKKYQFSDLGNNINYENSKNRVRIERILKSLRPKCFLNPSSCKFHILLEPLQFFFSSPRRHWLPCWGCIHIQ